MDSAWVLRWYLIPKKRGRYLAAVGWVLLAGLALSEVGGEPTPAITLYCSSWRTTCLSWSNSLMASGWVYMMQSRSFKRKLRLCYDSKNRRHNMNKILFITGMAGA